MRRLWLIIFFSLLVQQAYGFLPYYETSIAPGTQNLSIKKPQRCFRDCLPVANNIDFSRRESHKAKQRGLLLTRKLPFFTTISVKGSIDLIIKDGAANKMMVSQRYKGLSVKVYGTNLYISYTKPMDCPQTIRPMIWVTVCELQSLMAAGASCITMNHVNSNCGLVLTSCCNDRICLNGPTNVVRIVNTGNGSICARNVDTSHLEILATRHSMTRVSGLTRDLFIRSFQNSTVDTQFMCSDMAMVQAQDQSLVTVKTRGSLRAFASGVSNIYYRTIPSQLFQHNLYSGNVLPM